jgi:putative molybdopterin biosynthesis protein
MDFLTTSEAADYVRLGEHKLYELVTAGAIPCSKVAGKWLFPRHELDLWVLSGLARPAGMVAADPPPIVGFLGEKRLKQRAAELTGYDPTPSGQIRFAA